MGTTGFTFTRVSFFTGIYDWANDTKEIKERNLLYNYGYSKEVLPNFRKLFGGEITEEKLEEFFKLGQKIKK